MRVVRSADTEAVPRAVIRQVEKWVDARDRGCRLVASIDGTPAEEWSFIARRLSEPDRQRATHPFAYAAEAGGGGK